MLELIKEIPGPAFLVLYVLVAVLVAFFAKQYAKNDYTKEMEIPEPSQLTPLDIALLARGVKGTIMVSIFNLWRDKKIDIVKNDKKIELTKLSSDVDGLNEVEQKILEKTDSKTLYGDFFSPQSMSGFELLLQPNKGNLERLKLLPDSEVKERYRKAIMVSKGFLLLFGGTKLLLGLSRGRPFLFLLLAMVISIIVLKKQIVPIYTALGRKFIAASSQRFEWLKRSNDSSLMTDNNLLYGVALFGIAAFMGSSLGPILENPAFLDQYANASVGGCAGGCGGGGGGGCGGGCGGCGG